jgi:hypothetical protein
MTTETKKNVSGNEMITYRRIVRVEFSYQCRIHKYIPKLAGAREYYVDKIKNINKVLMEAIK